MSGRIIRRGHVCEGKPSATVGTIWQCDCGRYWAKQVEGWVITSSLAVGFAAMVDNFAAAQAEARRKQLPRDGGSS